MNMSVTITEEQLALPPAQRAMIAARMASIPRYIHKGETDITVKEAAKLLGVSSDTVSCARMILRYGTADIVKGVEDGVLSVGRAYKATTIPKTKHVQAKFNGENPARIERIRERALIWRQLREALIGLASLPLAADVLPIARRMDRHRNIMSKLPSALAWLKEFADVCHGEAAVKVTGEDAGSGCGEV